MMTEALPTRAVVLHPDTRARQARRLPEHGLAEAVSLAAALPGLDIRWAEVVRLPRVHPGMLFGSGKVAELKARLAADEVDLVLVDGPVSPVQQRNLEKEWGVKLLDRTSLILEIFADRARTREGVLQVELAALSYQRSRLVRAWTHLERQRGGFGFVGGPGETQIEADRRAIDDQVIRLKRQLEQRGENARTAPRRPRQGAVPDRRAGRLYQRRKIHPVQPDHRCRSAGKGHALRHARPDHAGGRAAHGRRRSSCPIPSASSPTCRPNWSPPSAPRWKRCCRPT